MIIDLFLPSFTGYPGPLVRATGSDILSCLAQVSGDPVIRSATQVNPLREIAQPEQLCSDMVHVNVAEIVSGMSTATITPRAGITQEIAADIVSSYEAEVVISGQIRSDETALIRCITGGDHISRSSDKTLTCCSASEDAGTSHEVAAQTLASRRGRSIKFYLVEDDRIQGWYIDSVLSTPTRERMVLDITANDALVSEYLIYCRC